MNELALFAGADGGLRELAIFAGAGGGILAGELIGDRTVPESGRIPDVGGPLD